MSNIYWIKREFRFMLTGFPGLQIVSESLDYIKIEVIPTNHSNYSKNKRLPPHCDIKLVCCVLEKLEQNKISSVALVILQDYIQLAKEQEDYNNQLKSNVKTALTEMFWGAVKLLIGGGIFAVALLLIGLGLSSIVVHGVGLLIVLAMGVTLCGTWDIAVGIFKLAVGITAVCFRQKNEKDLSSTKDELEQMCKLATSQLPSYEEIMKKDSVAPSAPYYPVPPNYQQAIAAPLAQDSPLPPPAYTPTFFAIAPNPVQFFYVNTFGPINTDSYTPMAMNRH